MQIGGLAKFSLSDFPGFTAAIIFTIGCNFRCPYCHNKSLWDLKHPKISEEEIFKFLKERQGKLDGVVISGGEPTIHSDLSEFIKKIKYLGYKIKLNTNGTNPNILKALLKDKLLDYIAMDIKSPFALYDKVCAVKVDINAIKKSFDLVLSSKIPHEFRTTWPKDLLDKIDIDNIKNTLPKNTKYVIQDCIKSQ